MMATRRFLCALLVLSLVPQTACRDSKATASGTLMVREGSATIVIAGTPQVVAAQKTAEVPLGAVVKTAPDGRAVVRWGEQLHSLEPDTELRFDAPSPDGSEKGVSKVELVRGLVTFFLPKGEAGKAFKFQAGCGTVVAAVKGTIFRVDGRTRDLNVDVLRGTVALFKRGSADTEGSNAGPAERKPAPEPEGEPIAELKPAARGIVPDAGPSAARSPEARSGTPDAKGVVSVPVNEKDVEAQVFILKVLVEENNRVIDQF